MAVFTKHKRMLPHPSIVLSQCVNCLMLRLPGTGLYSQSFSGVLVVVILYCVLSTSIKWVMPHVAGE